VTDARVRRRRWALGGIGVLYALSIPWYRAGGDSAPQIVLGMPDWVATAFGCYALVAVLNAVAWLATDLDDPPRRGHGE